MQVTAEYYQDVMTDPEPVQLEQAPDLALQRPRWLPFAFIFPMLMAGISWITGGMSLATDCAFVLLTVLCAGALLIELINFPQKLGLGGCLLFGGILVWFCFDYLSNWLGHDFNGVGTSFGPQTIAKSAFFHCMFIFSAVCGLMIQRGRFMVKLLQAVPEPSSEKFYFVIMVILALIGISPFLLFTNKGFFDAVFTVMTAGRSDASLIWTVGRTGNLNYSWGAYVAQILQVGGISAQFSVFYALLIARSPILKAIAWGNWLFWLALGFGSGSRGELLFLALPAIFLIFMKYQAIAGHSGRRFSVRAYLPSLLLLLAVLAIAQVQLIYRNSGFADVDLRAAEGDLVKIQGNTMFSEGLDGFELIPDQRPFFYGDFPGEGLVRAMPQTAFWFLVGPIPRALWTEKPIDPAWAWRAGGKGVADDMQGTTVSSGLVGYWYFRYGWMGVVQGGLLFGWLLVIGERAIQTSEGRPMRLLIALGFCIWLFRSFRDFNFVDLYPVLMGAVLLFGFIRLQRLLFSPENSG